MTLSNLNRVIMLLGRLFDSRHSTLPIIETAPQKPPCRALPIEKPLPRATPESQNLPSDLLAAFLAELRDEPTLDIHHVLVLRNGKVVSESNFGTQDLRIWKNTFSACKSITSLAVGMLVDEGLLGVDDPVIKFFDRRVSALSRITLKDLAVRHLLTMTSCIPFNEAASMTETDWVKGFLNTSISGERGRSFSYNSLNTYMLSAIVKQITGQGLTEYLNPRLFGPLGITEVFWEKCPMGVEKGGWGFYIRAEDMAKIGQLVLQKGMWEGRRLISESWIAEATSAKVETPPNYGGYNYGYQIWVGRNRNTFLFNGMLGQNVLGFKDSGILLVTHAGNDEIFQQSNFFDIVDRCFSDPFSKELPEDPEAYARLAAMQSQLNSPPQRRGWLRLKDALWKPRRSVPKACSYLSGKTYAASEECAASAGLLPVLLQVMQNNYTKGLLSVGFRTENGRFWVDFSENDETYRFPVGFTEPAVWDLSFHGEPYRVSVSGAFATDEDDRPVLKLGICYLETPCKRLLKLYFSEDSLLLRFAESPGLGLISGLLEEMKTELSGRHILSSFLSKLDHDFISYKVNAVLEPRVKMSLSLPERAALSPDEKAPLRLPGQG